MNTFEKEHKKRRIYTLKRKCDNEQAFEHVNGQQNKRYIQFKMSAHISLENETKTGTMTVNEIHPTHSSCNTTTVTLYIYLVGIKWCSN